MAPYAWLFSTWGLVTVALIALLIYRSRLTRTEADWIPLTDDAREDSAIQTQTMIEMKTRKLVWPIRVLGTACIVLLLVILGFWLYSGITTPPPAPYGSCLGRQCVRGGHPAAPDFRREEGNTPLTRVSFSSSWAACPSRLQCNGEWAAGNARGSTLTRRHGAQFRVAQWLFAGLRERDPDRSADRRFSSGVLRRVVLPAPHAPRRSLPPFRHTRPAQ